MQGNFSKKAMIGAAALSLSMGSGAFAESSDNVQDLQAQVQAMQNRLAELEAQQSQDWMSERRAEEVKGLIAEVLSDADTRATLLQDGLTAGHDGKFFLASADGKFRLNIGGQLQFRYLIQTQDNGTNDESDSGFQVRRMKIKFAGHVGSPKFKYGLVLAGDRGDGAVEVEDVFISHKTDKGIEFKLGKFKLPFLLEELTSSSRQVGVDRSPSTEYFTLDRSEQLQISYSADKFKAMFSINDGADEEFSNPDADPVEFAVTGRVQLKIQGDWGALKDFVAWKGQDTAFFVGAAFHYQSGDGNNGDNSSESDANYLAWTVDVLYESKGWSVMGAYMGADLDADDDGSGVTFTDRTANAFLIQGGYMVTEKIMPFARYDFIDTDVDGEDSAQVITLGANYFIKKHKIKVTADVVYFFDGDNPTGNPFGNSEFGSGLGFGDSVADDEELILVRLQVQVLY